MTSITNPISTHRKLLTPDMFNLFGVTINNATMLEAVDWVCGKHLSTKLAYFVNVNSFNIATDDQYFSNVLSQADRLFADGSGVRMAAAHAGYRLKANVNGTDLLPLLCARLAATNKSLYLLGAAPGVAKSAAKNLQKRYPSLKVAGTQHGYFDLHDTDQIIKRVNKSGCDVLLVAMGSPLQEQWLHKHRDQLNVPCALAVGGLFDFFSGNIPRAPLWLRNLGCEWIWRLLQEPSRMWRRYLLGNPIFLFRVFFKTKELQQ